MEDLNSTLATLKEYLKLSKDLGQLLTGSGSFINCFNKDTHRLHGRVDSLGANTGRMTHSKPNITQLSKDLEFRELMSVPDGKLLVDVDADALELVMLGHYLGQFDNYEFAHIVDTGDKSNGTDIHTVNQHRVGLPTRDAAKTFIYSVIYGAGETKIGIQTWDKTPFEYTSQEYRQAKEKVEKRLTFINGKAFYPIAKETLAPYDEDIIMQTVYGARVSTLFRDNTKGYKQLVEHTIANVKNNKIIGLDGRLLNVRAEHKALNLLLQSAGAIFMKYYLVCIDEGLNKLFTHGKEYAYVANIHDAVNLEIIPEVKEPVREILTKSFKTASDMLGLRYQVKGEPHFGRTQAETH